MFYNAFARNRLRSGSESAENFVLMAEWKTPPLMVCFAQNFLLFPWIPFVDDRFGRFRVARYDNVLIREVRVVRMYNINF